MEISKDKLDIVDIVLLYIAAGFTFTEAMAKVGLGR